MNLVLSDAFGQPCIGGPEDTGSDLSSEAHPVLVRPSFDARSL
jgi:hypothetical protein